MSFASGFNSGLNLTASLRASRDRQEALDQNQLRLQVTQRYNDIRAEALADEMRVEKEVRQREESDRLASQVVLGKYASDVRSLNLTNLEDFKKYNELSSQAAAQIRDPAARQQFQAMDKHYQEIGMMNGIQMLKKRAVERRLQEEDMVQELARRGHIVNPDDPQRREKLDGFALFKGLEKMAGDDVPLSDLGVDPANPYLTPEQSAKASEKLREIGGDRSELRLRSQDFRDKQGIGEQLDSLDVNSPTYLRDALEVTRNAPKMSQFEQQSLDEAFTALDLSRGVDDAIKDLESGTGRVFGEAIANVKETFNRGEDTAVLKQSVTRLVPSVARGVFGEVGVLTDSDVQRYAQTLASLKQSKASNVIAMGMTKALIARSLRRKLMSGIANRENVSMYSGRLQQIQNTPVVVYTSLDQASKNLKRDIGDNYVQPGQQFSFWDAQAKELVTRRIGTLEEYGFTDSSNATK